MNIKVIGIVFLFFGMLSCVKDIDFDQTDDLKLEPVYELDFVYSKIRTAKFTNPFDDSFVQVLRDTLQDELFSGDVGDKLLRAELLVTLENTIPVGFSAELQFLDVSNSVIPISISPIRIDIASGSTNNTQNNERTFLISKEDLEALKSATKLASAVTIEGTDNDLDGELILQSKAIYYTSLLDE